MLYDYSQHIKEMQHDTEKRERILDEYTGHYGSQEGMDIHDTKFYKDYLEKFEVPFLLAVPQSIEDDFDWDLLTKLVVGSLSSEYDLVLDEDWKKKPKGKPKAHIYITVKNDKQTLTKDIEELWGFQVIRLFEIYVEEQMSLFNEMAEEKEEKNFDWSWNDSQDDEEEKTELEEEQEVRLEKFQRLTERLAKNDHAAQRIKQLV